MEAVFRNIYENSHWGDNKNENYKGSSGPGSDIEYNIIEYIPFLKQFIKDKSIYTIIDLGCGDFRCGNMIYDDLNITYHGYDTYDKVISNNKNTFSLPKFNFTHLDIFGQKESIQSGDLCILKDILQHWKINNIYSFLDYLTENKVFKYI